ncbi:MAG: pseudouridine-5'-phosphate glycosidase [Acidimicrobiaceae bacterium]|nr:pseudouridine-5'-phosphate glycosidase [Acidimicrobiaceae bacterium]
MTSLPLTHLSLNDEVATALSEGRAVVALETTIVVHGLPAPQNLEVAAQCEAVIRAAGAVPATIGVIDGVIRVGMEPSTLADLADPSRHCAKLSARDLGFAIAHKSSGATTVAGTIAAAHYAGISVMATGGLGGVHRGANVTYDESADLSALSRIPVLVVASGVKSILNIGATLERLDSLGVPVTGYRTSNFPGFYLADSGFRLDWRVESPALAAAAFAAHRHWSSSGFLVANPVREDLQLDATLHDEALTAALSHAAASGAVGKDVTPVILAEFARFTGGASVQVNRDLVVANAALSGQIAVELAQLS